MGRLCKCHERSEALQSTSGSPRHVLEKKRPASPICSNHATMGKEDLKKLPDKLTDSEKKKLKNENKVSLVLCPVRRARSRKGNAARCAATGVSLDMHPQSKPGCPVRVRAGVRCAGQARKAPRGADVV